MGEARGVTPTIRSAGGGNSVPVICKREENEPGLFSIAGNIIGRDAKHGGNQIGYAEGSEPMYTITSTDRHAVCKAERQDGGSSCLNPWETQSGRVFAQDGVFPSLVGGGRGNRGYAGGCVLDGETQEDPPILPEEEGRQTLAFDTTQITSRHNRSNPQWNGPCHTLTVGDAPSVCIESYAEGSFSQFREGEVGTLRASGGCLGGGSETLVVEHPNADAEKPKDADATCQPIEPSTLVVRCGCEGGGKGALVSEGLSMTLSTGNNQTLFQPSESRMVVRRLTPVECERLQGFPDDWTRVEWNGKPEEECPKGRRYKAIGNSMAVPVMEWIGRGIAFVGEAQTNREG